VVGVAPARNFALDIRHVLIRIIKGYTGVPIALIACKRA
jgi:hypothetical protein